MDDKQYAQLLRLTAFSCMISDSHIDAREIEQLRKLYTEFDLLKNIDFEKEYNYYIERLNSEGVSFIISFFSQLESADFTQEEMVRILDVALRTIIADEKIEYKEIRFFKNIRHRLPISDEAILNSMPGIESYLEQDITNDSSVAGLTKRYIESIEFPKFKRMKSSEF